MNRHNWNINDWRQYATDLELKLGYAEAYAAERQEDMLRLDWLANSEMMVDCSLNLPDRYCVRLSHSGLKISEWHDDFRSAIDEVMNDE